MSCSRRGRRWPGWPPSPPRRRPSSRGHTPSRPPILTRYPQICPPNLKLIPQPPQDPARSCRDQLPIILFSPFQCLPNEKDELERDQNLSRQGSLMKVPRDFTDSKHLIENEYKTVSSSVSSNEYKDNDYKDNNVFIKSHDRIPPPTETDF